MVKIFCVPTYLDVDEDGISDWKEGTSDLDGDDIINCLDDDSDGDGHVMHSKRVKISIKMGSLIPWIPIRIMMGFRF